MTTGWAPADNGKLNNGKPGVDGSRSRAPSIDQVIAGLVGQTTAYKSLMLASMAGTHAALSFDERGTLLSSPYSDKYNKFDLRRFLQEAFSGLMNQDADAISRARAMNKSILDASMGQFADLDARLGQEDRQVLAAHLAKLRSLEGRLSSGNSSLDACTGMLETEWRRAVPEFNDPSFPGSFDYTKGSLNFDPYYARIDGAEAVNEMAVMALACDLTRVVTIEVSGGTHENWLPREHIHWQVPDDKTPGKWKSLDDWHQVAHNGIYYGSCPTKDDKGECVRDQKMLMGMTRTMEFIHERNARHFASLLRRLKSIKEGDGTMLDNTLILWTNDFGNHAQNSYTLFEGTSYARPIMGSHQWQDHSYILAGNLGGQLDTGRHLTYQSPKHHNQLLLSLAKLYGYTKDTFGDPDFCPGPLPGLA